MESRFLETPLKIAWEKNTFALTNGDSINVLKKPGLILMAGEVNVPGYISYKRNDSIMDYIETDGGFTSFADEGSIYITYPNGISNQSKDFFHQKSKKGLLSILTKEQLVASKN